MRVLVTGHDGYIGTVLVPLLSNAGHDVVGLDSRLFAGCGLGAGLPEVPEIRIDVRDAEVDLLSGFDAVIHLAAISNDPVGELDPACTYAINHEASVRLARLSKRAGVERFLFASSCSLYGSASPDQLLDETAPFNPVTAYGRSKVLVERDVSQLADDDFSPTFLRNATVYGYSPRLRGDLVVNNLVGFAFTTGEILIMSDGTPWRPLIHVEDVARSFIGLLEAPRHLVHNQAFNIGKSEDNYQIRDIADLVAKSVPNSKVVYAEDGGPDLRCYRVDFGKLSRLVPKIELQWTLEAGIQQLAEAYERHGLTFELFSGRELVRVKHIRSLLDEGRLDADLRWIEGAGGYRRNEFASARPAEQIN